MSILGKATVQIDGDTKPLNNSVKGIDGGLRKAILGSAVGNIIADGVGAVAGKIVDVGKAVGTAVIGKGLDRALNIQDARKQLEGLGHDTENIDIIMSNALESVKGTAFGLGDAATVAASAVGAGIQPGKELERTLKLTSNAAALAKTGLGDMGSILNKVWTSGRVGTEELNQLADRGIPIWSKLAEQYGVTQEELRKMVSAGEVDAETFANVLEGTVGNAAGAMGETARGAFANIGASLARMGEMFVGPAVAGAPALFGSISGAVDSLSGVLAPLAEQFGEWLAPAMESVAKWISELDFGALFSDMGSGEGMLSNLMALFSPLGVIFKEMLPHLSQLGEVFKQVGKTIGQALVTVLPILGDALMMVLQAVTPLLPVLGDALMSILPVLANLISTVVTAVAPLIPMFGQALINAVTMLLPPLLELVTAVFPILAQVIGMVVTAVVPLIPAVLQIIEAFLPLLPVLAELVVSLLPPLMALLDALMPIITILVDLLVAVLVPAFELVGTIITWLVENIIVPLVALISGGMTDSINQYSEIWTTVWNAIKSVFSAVWNGIKTTFNTVWNAIKSVFTAGLNFYKSFWSSIWNGIKAVASSVWNAIKSTISGAINSVKSTISNVVNTIKSVWTGAWNTVKSTLTTVWNGIKRGVTSGITSVLSTIRGLPGRALSALGNIGSKLFNAGKNLIKGFTNGIKNMFGSVKSTLGNLTSSLTSWKGPESLDKVLLSNNGELLIGGFIKGLEGKYGDVKKSLKGFTNGLSGDMNTDLSLSGGGGRSMAGTGPISVNITVNGSDPVAGKQAGQAAGDALLKRLGNAVQVR